MFWITLLCAGYAFADAGEIHQSFVSILADQDLIATVRLPMSIGLDPHQFCTSLGCYILELPQFHSPIEYDISIDTYDENITAIKVTFGGIITRKNSEENQEFVAAFIDSYLLRWLREITIDLGTILKRIRADSSLIAVKKMALGMKCQRCLASAALIIRKIQAYAQSHAIPLKGYLH